jgi:hypothetical protein
VHSVTTAYGVPNCPFGGAVRHLPHPSRVIEHDAWRPVQGLASDPPRNPADECRAFYLTGAAPNGRSQRPHPLTLRAACHVRWGADPRRRRVLGGVVPMIEPSYDTPWAVRPEPRPAIGVVGTTANERDPAHAKPARAAALLAVQQYHPPPGRNLCRCRRKVQGEALLADPRREIDSAAEGARGSLRAGAAYHNRPVTLSHFGHRD